MDIFEMTPEEIIEKNIKKIRNFTCGEAEKLVDTPSFIGEYIKVKNNKVTKYEACVYKIIFNLTLFLKKELNIGIFIINDADDIVITFNSNEYISIRGNNKKELYIIDISKEQSDRLINSIPIIYKYMKHGGLIYKVYSGIYW